MSFKDPEKPGEVYVVYVLENDRHGLEAYFINIAFEALGHDFTTLYNCLVTDFVNPDLEGGPFRVISDEKLKSICLNDLGGKTPYELCMNAVHALNPDLFGCTAERENLRIKGE